MTHQTCNWTDERSAAVNVPADMQVDWLIAVSATAASTIQVEVGHERFASAHVIPRVCNFLALAQGRQSIWV
jgi:hypothetical protein